MGSRPANHPADTDPSLVHALRPLPLFVDSDGEPLAIARADKLGPLISRGEKETRITARGAPEPVFAG